MDDSHRPNFPCRLVYREALIRDANKPVVKVAVCASPPGRAPGGAGNIRINTGRGLAGLAGTLRNRHLFLRIHLCDGGEWEADCMLPKVHELRPVDDRSAVQVILKPRSDNGRRDDAVLNVRAKRGARLVDDVVAYVMWQWSRLGAPRYREKVGLTEAGAFAHNCQWFVDELALAFTGVPYTTEAFFDMFGRHLLGHTVPNEAGATVQSKNWVAWGGGLPHWRGTPRRYPVARGDTADYDSPEKWRVGPPQISAADALEAGFEPHIMTYGWLLPDAPPISASVDTAADLVACGTLGPGVLALRSVPVVGVTVMCPGGPPEPGALLCALIDDPRRSVPQTVARARPSLRVQPFVLLHLRNGATLCVHLDTRTPPGGEGDKEGQYLALEVRITVVNAAEFVSCTGMWSCRSGSSGSQAMEPILGGSKRVLDKSMNDMMAGWHGYARGAGPLGLGCGGRQDNPSASEVRYFEQLQNSYSLRFVAWVWGWFQSKPDHPQAGRAFDIQRQLFNVQETAEVRDVLLRWTELAFAMHDACCRRAAGLLDWPPHARFLGMDLLESNPTGNALFICVHRNSPPVGQVPFVWVRTILGNLNTATNELVVPGVACVDASCDVNGAVPGQLDVCFRCPPTPADAMAWQECPEGSRETVALDQDVPISEMWWACREWSEHSDAYVPGQCDQLDLVEFLVHRLTANKERSFACGAHHRIAPESECWVRDSIAAATLAIRPKERPGMELHPCDQCSLAHRAHPAEYRTVPWRFGPLCSACVSSNRSDPALLTAGFASPDDLQQRVVRVQVCCSATHTRDVRCYLALANGKIWCTFATLRRVREVREVVATTEADEAVYAGAAAAAVRARRHLHVEARPATPTDLAYMNGSMTVTSTFTADAELSTLEHTFATARLDCFVRRPSVATYAVGIRDEWAWVDAVADAAFPADAPPLKSATGCTDIVERRRLRRELAQTAAGETSQLDASIRARDGYAAYARMWKQLGHRLGMVWMLYDLSSPVGEMEAAAAATNA